MFALQNASAFFAGLKRIIALHMTYLPLLLVLSLVDGRVPVWVGKFLLR